MRIVLILLLTYLPHASLLAFQEVGHDTISVLDAKQANKLLVSIRGAYNPNKFIPEVVSSHYGQCIDIKMKNITDTAFTVALTCGTMLLSKDSSTQNMVITKSLYYTLLPKQKIITRLYAMCGQLHRNSPDIYVNYELGNLAPEPLRRLALVIEKNNQQDKIGQYAVWAVTDKATKDELGGDDETFKQTQALLNKAKVRYNIFGKSSTTAPTAPRPQVKLSKADSNELIIKKIEEELAQQNHTLTDSVNSLQTTATASTPNSKANTLPQTNFVIDEVKHTKTDDESYWLLAASIAVGLFGLYYFSKHTKV